MTKPTIFLAIGLIISSIAYIISSQVYGQTIDDTVHEAWVKCMLHLSWGDYTMEDCNEMAIGMRYNLTGMNK